MARKLRVEYDGAIYHILNRGDRGERIQRDDQDARIFCRTLDELCDKTDWQIHAYCLMGNHFHLVAETPKANLVVGMKWFLGTYTSRFNRRHKAYGHLFSGRYKAIPVCGSGNHYLRTACEYVHLNPSRARMISRKKPLSSYPWSSYPLFLQSPRKRPGWLRVDRVFGDWGIDADSPAGRRRFSQVMEERRALKEPEEFQQFRRGWFIGDDLFRKELLERMPVDWSESHVGEEHRELAEHRGERIVLKGLDAAGLKESDLGRLRKGDLRKVRIALRVRRETTLSLRWIAERLVMGSPAYVANLLWQARREE